MIKQKEKIVTQPETLTVSQHTPYDYVLKGTISSVCGMQKKFHLCHFKLTSGCALTHLCHCILFGTLWNSMSFKITGTVHFFLRN